MGTPSRKESLILSLPSVGQGIKAATFEPILGQRCYVNWPYLQVRVSMLCLQTSLFVSRTALGVYMLVRWNAPCACAAAGIGCPTPTTCKLAVAVKCAAQSRGGKRLQQAAYGCVRVSMSTLRAVCLYACACACVCVCYVGGSHHAYQ